jgi:hypothetical protein
LRESIIRKSQSPIRKLPGKGTNEPLKLSGPS